MLSNEPIPMNNNQNAKQITENIHIIQPNNAQVNLKSKQSIKGSRLKKRTTIKQNQKVRLKVPSKKSKREQLIEKNNKLIRQQHQIIKQQQLIAQQQQIIQQNKQRNMGKRHYIRW